MVSNLLALYLPWRCATLLSYMLQATEYQASPYLAWFWRTKNFARVMQRRTLDLTKTARLLKAALLCGMLVQIALGVGLVAYADSHPTIAGYVWLGLAAIISFPVVWAHLAVVPLMLGRLLIAAPKERRLIAESQAIFARHPGVKIAVAGSYGKTTMKELLQTVLSEGKKVAATPGNKNVAISHAAFAKRLQGDEDILIVEYGEGKPGDVAAFARTTQPAHGIITGLAPAHLDQYKTLEAAGRDIFSLADYLHGKQVYVNEESAAVKPFLKPGYHAYSTRGALGWKVTKVTLSPQATHFTLTKGRRSLTLTSGLLGAHQIGPLSLVAALSLELGLSEKQVTAGIAKTVPYEHRMQPRQLHGAWILDDTYNGNLEGIRAGTALLAALPAKRKWYVTPGLVDQGNDTAAIHAEMGRLIAAARPDIVVLMQNSVTRHIQEGLAAAGYTGKLTTEPHPLTFYTSLDHFVAAGDLVLMQNDWTDNYA